MKLNDLLKQPVGLLAENNIVKDILTPESSVHDLLNKMGEYRGNWDNLFIVYLTKESGKPDVIIKAEDFDKALQFLTKLDKEGKNFSEVKLGTLDLPECFPLKREQILTRTDSVEKATKIFSDEKDPTNILTIVDEGGSYIGKLRRSTLLSKINELTK